MDNTPVSPAPVVVTPIHPEQSRTLRLAWRTTVWTTIVGIAPDFIEAFLYYVMNDPAFADTVAGWFPRPLRYVAMTVLIGYAQKQIQLRKATAAPIAGTSVAENAQQLYASAANGVPTTTDYSKERRN